MLPNLRYAGVAELADALDLGSSAARRGGSSPFTRIAFFKATLAGLAQLVEHLICNQRVEGSTPLAGIFCESSSVVEHHLAKVGVAGSNPVFRLLVQLVRSFVRMKSCSNAGVAEQVDAQDLKSCGE